MRQIVLRMKAGTQSPEDLTVNVQDKTFDYLMTTHSPSIRVSSYFERDCPQVEEEYAEIFVDENCPFVTQVIELIPGSRIRTGLSLPCAMKEGEQLTIMVTRTPK